MANKEKKNKSIVSGEKNKNECESYEGERFIIKFKEPKQACTRCHARDKSGQTEPYTHSHTHIHLHLLYTNT